MQTRLFLLALALVGASVALVGAQAWADNSQGLTPAQIAQFTAQNAAAVSVLDPPLDPAVDPPGNLHAASVHRFDPAHTNLVGGKWVEGTGCPTQQPVATYPATSPTGMYTDPACTTGDPSDQSNWGLLVSKVGPTSNNASVEVELHNPKGITSLTELGYDIRKRGSLNLAGSHCGAGAPRFDIVTTTDTFFIGCNSPPPTTQTVGDGWTRLRWTGSPVLAFSATTFVLTPVTGTVQRIVIVFDEGTDVSGGPDQFGAAILDNIDVNGQILGHT
jgi:hypothetical protein